MDHTRLGTSGLEVSRIALGCMSFGDTSRMDWALDEEAALLLMTTDRAALLAAYDRVDQEHVDITVHGHSATVVTRNRVTASIWGSYGTWPLESTHTYARTGDTWVLRRSAATTY
jgi:hypothetical protein